MIPTFPTLETTLQLPGSAGTLETIIVPQPQQTNKVAIVCHPHPLHGGTMHNKVVTTTAKAFQQQSMSTIRFNYRGVGASPGSYGDFVGETEDLLAIIAWVKQQKPDVQLWLAGFSFGSYIAAQGAQHHPELVQQLFTIAPAVSHTDFSRFTAIKCPWIVIQGEEDEIVPPQAVYTWAENMTQHANIKVIKIADSSHFFHGKLLELRDILLSEITH